MHVEDILRIINLVLAILTIVWLVIRRLRNRGDYGRGSLRRDIWTSSFLWFLAAIVGTYEQLFDTGTYFRVVFTLGAILTTISILARPNKEWVDGTQG